MSNAQPVNAYAEQLRRWGCMRLRVTDRKLLGSERNRVNVAAAGLGRRAYHSYRYPYLYSRLGEPLGATESHPADPTTQLMPLAHEGGPRRQETIASERV